MFERPAGEPSVEVAAGTERPDELSIVAEQVSKRFTLRFRQEFLASGLARSLFGGRGTREEFWALRDIDFEVRRGESVAIIGPNGSGKTTLLSIVSGVTEPTHGRVGTRGRIAALLQLGAGFHPDLTGRENAYINAGVLGLTRSQTDAIYPAIAEFSELGHFLDAPIRRYSSGMLSRLGFSIAVHVEPDILIVDEVLGVGDQSFKRKCRERILRFVDRGVSILFVSHSGAQVRDLCERALYLEEGRQILYGEVDEVLEAYEERSGVKRKTSAPTGSATPAKPPTPTATAQPTPTPTPTPAVPAKPAVAPPVSRLRPCVDAPSARLQKSSAGVPASTYFYRNGPQLDLLFDELFPAIVADGLVPRGQPLRLRCWGSSLGAEPYSLAIEHDRRGPEYELAVEAIEIDPELVQAALLAEYNELELSFQGLGHLRQEVRERYFERTPEGHFRLSPRIRSRVLFAVGDLLAAESRFALPVVAAQNLLQYFEPEAARCAIDHLVEQVVPGGYLLLGGTPPEVLEAAVERHALEPSSRRIEEIHDGWRARRSQPLAPYGLGPLDRSAPRWLERQSSIFRRPLASGGGERDP